MIGTSRSVRVILATASGSVAGRPSICQNVADLYVRVEVKQNAAAIATCCRSVARR